MEEDGKDVEEGRKEMVRPGLGGKGVDDVTDGEWGALVREAKVDGKLVGRNKAVVRDDKEGVMVELWGTEEEVHPEREVFAVVKEEKAWEVAVAVEGRGVAAWGELVPSIAVVGRTVLKGMDVEVDDAVCSSVAVTRVSGVGVTEEVEKTGNDVTNAV